MKFIAGLRVWGNWEIGENVLKVFLRLRGSANRRVDLFLPLIASISGWRQCDASKCEMRRLGRVTPSAGRDVIDRKACFLPFLVQAAVLASIPGPASDLETFGQSKTAGSGDPRRTRQSDGGVGRPAPNESPNGGVRRPAPNESVGTGVRGDGKAPERSQFARVLVVERSKLTTNQGGIGQAERTHL